MYADGFFETRRRSPVGLATVTVLHAAALGAVVLFGTTSFIREKESRLTVVPITERPPPPVEPPPPERRPEETPRHRSTIDQPQRITPVPTDNRPVAGESDPPDRAPVGPQPVEQRPPPPPPDPLQAVRRAAQVDPRYAGDLQPPYPRGEEEAQRAGQVRVRITIGTDGRVTAIQRLSATSDAFWQATERHARRRWRFRPATEDGRPVVSTMAFTVTFRIPDA